MQVYRDGNTYKIAKIAGPKHNFLGLVLDLRKQTSTPRVQAISTHQHGMPASISGDEVLKQVTKGVANANLEFKSHFVVDAIEYVPTDTPDDGVYTLLARRIIEEAAKNMLTRDE
jgi:hypothetical protein